MLLSKNEARQVTFLCPRSILWMSEESPELVQGIEHLQQKKKNLYSISVF